METRQNRQRLGCEPNTVRNEIKRGTVELYNGHVRRYKADAGQRTYETNRRNSCRHYGFLEKQRFLEYVCAHFREDDWSLDACAGRALKLDGFERSETLCTKTLYNYADLGLLPGIRNIDLPEKLKRRTKDTAPRQFAIMFNGTERFARRKMPDCNRRRP